MKLLDLFRTYKKKILFIFSLTIVENVAWIIEPWIFGTLIDEFILKANGSVFQLAPIKFLPLFFEVFSSPSNPYSPPPIL